jgi:hypothetical protein
MRSGAHQSFVAARSTAIGDPGLRGDMADQGQRWPIAVPLKDEGEHIGRYARAVAVRDVQAGRRMRGPECALALFAMLVCTWSSP